MSVLSKILIALLFLAVGLKAQRALRNEQMSAAVDLKVAAASDLTNVMDKIAPAFEKQTGIHVSVSLGSSGNFFAQIQSGAPFDVFLSADKSYPEKLQQTGKTEGAVIPYARGQLVLWVPKTSGLHFPAKGQTLDGNLDALKSPMVGKIAIANPDHAPYGRAAVAALSHFGVYDQLKPKLVLGENISQTAQFAQSGNTDVAFLSLSVALSGAMQRDGRFVLLPDNSYPVIEQAGVVVKSSNHKAEAQRFLEFLASPAGQSLMHDFGFAVLAK